MNDHIAQWRDHLIAERGLSAHTIENYGRDVALFIKFLKRPGHTATRQDIQRFMVAQLRKRSGRSVYRRLCALRSFYRFLRTESVIAIEPTRGIKTPRYSHKLPAWLDESKMRKLLRAAEKQSGEIGLRDALVLHLLYGSGLRANEVVTIRKADVAPDLTTVKVVGKGNIERYALLSGRCRDLLARYLESLSEPSEWLFSDVRGRPGQLTRQWLWKIVRAAAARVKVSAHPHTFRHSAAAHMTCKGADVSIVQQFLGHASPETTMIYAHVDLKALRRAFNRFHPRAHAEKGAAHDSQ